MKFVYLICIGFLLIYTSCRSSGDAVEISKSNAVNANISAKPEETPKNFSATQLLVYLKTNESETAKMLTDKEIIVQGEVWQGGGTGSFEFYSNSGRITCNLKSENTDASKLAQLEKLVADYLSKRSDRMPFVKAKGIYKNNFPPAAPPNDHWKIMLENCAILDVSQ